jgi:hypothetical protein
MVGFRFSLVLDFGVGPAARATRGVRCQEDPGRRMEEGRRAAVLHSAPRLPGDLGWGPLEPEGFGRESGEPERSRGAQP